jgi:hypothetical protein
MVLDMSICSQDIQITVKIEIKEETSESVDFDIDKVTMERGGYKLTELKEIAKKSRLPVSGNKSELVARINNYFRIY